MNNEKIGPEAINAVNEVLDRHGIEGITAHKIEFASLNDVRENKEFPKIITTFMCRCYDCTGPLGPFGRCPCVPCP
jgi:hypothetical protein